MSDAASIRSQAVENVDAHHGYTVEFSNTPGQHAAEYDEEEARLTAEAESSAASGLGSSADAPTNEDRELDAASTQRRRGLVWRGRTPFGQRFYGIDFGRFALGVLLDA